MHSPALGVMDQTVSCDDTRAPLVYTIIVLLPHLSALDWHGFAQQLAARPEHDHVVAVLEHGSHGPVALPHPLLEGHLRCEVAASDTWAA